MFHIKEDKGHSKYGYSLKYIVWADELHFLGGLNWKLDLLNIEYGVDNEKIIEKFIEICKICWPVEVVSQIPDKWWVPVGIPEAEKPCEDREKFIQDGYKKFHELLENETSFKKYIESDKRIKDLFNSNERFSDAIITIDENKPKKSKDINIKPEYFKGLNIVNTRNFMEFDAINKICKPSYTATCMLRVDVARDENIIDNWIEDIIQDVAKGEKFDCEKYTIIKDNKKYILDTLIQNLERFFTGRDWKYIYKDIKVRLSPTGSICYEFGVK